MHGVPAMIKVPTHIEVKIIQTDYWLDGSAKQEPESVDSQQEQNSEDEPEHRGKSSADRELRHLPANTLRNVEIREICTGKMVMIDPKRPASGQGEFAIKYDDQGDGTIQTLNYKAVDETLKNSAALASALLKAFPTGGSPPGNLSNRNDDPATLIKATRTIAIQRFPVGNCSQSEIESFVAKYINACAPADCTNPTMYAPAKTAGGR